MTPTANRAVAPATARDALVELLGLPVWTLGELRRAVDRAESRPCDGASVALFHPADTSGETAVAAGVEVARAFCDDCPVRVECLALSMCEISTRVDGRTERTQYGPHGVWGGLPAATREAVAPRWHTIQRLAGLTSPSGVGTCAACGATGLPGRRSHCDAECRRKSPLRGHRGVDVRGVAAVSRAARSLPTTPTTTAVPA